MCLKTAFALWFLLGLTEYANAAAAVDDNAIVNLAMENYYAILNESGTSVGCCPIIVPPGPKGSVIESFSGYRGNVALIVDYGTCTNADHGLICAVDWGDGSSKDIKYLQDFGPCQLTHQYAKYNSYYTVKAYYCGSLPYGGTRCCRSLYGTIYVSYSPGKVNLQP